MFESVICTRIISDRSFALIHKRAFVFSFLLKISPVYYTKPPNSTKRKSLICADFSPKIRMKNRSQTSPRPHTKDVDFNANLDPLKSLFSNRAL
nr:MAG TPA: hypothetical protein [Caudoviricetes sp.]